MGAPWRLWGPYLAGRQWGTVREDYSEDADPWGFFPFEHARARAYRWGEDGLGGISDRYGFLNFSVALWNGRDPILKERLFGLTNEEGNHGEDAKEYWWAVDGTPTHSWMQWLYRYPQAEFPYEQLRSGERRTESAGARVRARRHRRPRRGPVLRRPGDLCQGVAGGRLHRRHRHQPRPRPGAAAPAAAGLVPQHLVVGPRQAAGHADPAAGAHADRDRAGGGRGRARLPGPVHPGRRGQPRRPLLRQRDERRRPVRRPAQREPLSEGRDRPPRRPG